MDESAEWRRRYDAEVEKAGRCSKKLNEVSALLFISVSVNVSFEVGVALAECYLYIS